MIAFDPFERRDDIAREDVNITLYGTPRPTPEQLARGPWPGALRDGPPKPPAPTPAANAPAAAANDGQRSGSILDSLEEPKPGEVFKAMDAPLPESDKVRADHEKADKVVDRIFSGTPQESETAKKLLPFQPPEVRRLVERKINERVQKIVSDAVRAGTNAAAGPPRTSN